MRYRRFLSVLISILLVSSLFSNVSLAQTADADVIVLSPGNATLDLSQSTSTIIPIDDLLSVSYSGSLTMTVVIEVSGSGNVLDYDPTISSAITGSFLYSPTYALSLDGTADATTWQSLLRSVTLSNDSMQYLPLSDEQRTVTFTALGVTDTKTVDVIAPFGLPPGGDTDGSTGGGTGGGTGSENGGSNYTMEQITPVISQQPVNLTINQGEHATLGVTASVYAGTLSYQWYSNTVNASGGWPEIAGATDPTYTVPTSSPGTMYYYVDVVNTIDTQIVTIFSDIVTVTVNAAATNAEAPTITQQPSGATVNAGETASLSVTANVSAGTISYQWYSNNTNSTSGGTLISGATNAAYTVPTTTAGTTYYYVVVTNTDNTATGNQTASATSSAVLVTVVQALGSISTVAGTGTNGYSGDGGAADEAQLYNPYNVAIDSSGNVYIADSSNHRIRKVALDGTISTFAGTGTPGYSGDGRAADEAQLNVPIGVAVDHIGNVYIADTFNNRIRRVALDGTISTVAGTGSSGYSGDGGPADQAQLNWPFGVVLDNSGNVYIADRNNHRIRKVALDGTISTVAGTNGGYSGDGGAAIAAQIYSPNGVAVDSSGNVYIADRDNHRIRKVALDGTISTFAGTGSLGYSGDGGAADEAQLYYPTGVALDSSGNMYIADGNNHRIRKVALDGTISTFAGTGSLGYSGDGGTAYEAQLNFPNGVAVDSSGNVYIADKDNHRIRKAVPSVATVDAEAPSITEQPEGDTVNVDESVSLSVTATVGAGSLSYQWYSNDTDSNSGGTLIDGATRSAYEAPTSSAGETYYYVVVTNTDTAATGNQTATATSDAVLVTVNELTPIITTIAGIGSSGYSGDSGPADQAKLNNPYAVAVDSNGNIYIADTTNNRIRKIAADGTMSTLAGTGTPGYSGDGGPANQARLNNPSGIATDSSGNVYIADRYNNRVRKIALDGTISTVAGTGSASYSGDGGPANQAGLNSPTGIAVDSSGNMYIADRYNNRIRKIASDGTISTVAGTGTSGYSGDGGPANQAQVYWPFGIELDSSENLYIADYSNHRIRKVTSDGTITTVAGTGTSGYSGDGGPAEESELSSPSGIAIDSSGNLYIAEYGGSRIRKIAPDGTISTVAGTGTSGYSGDGGAADKAIINRPLGIAVDSSGNVYIPDTFNHRIRKITFSTLPPEETNAEAPTITQQPIGATVKVGNTANLSVTASGTGTLSYQWYSNNTDNNSGGTLIDGATSSAYNAPTATVGETYYYVVVTNTDNSATGSNTATAISEAVLVKVNVAPTSSSGSNTPSSTPQEEKVDQPVKPSTPVFTKVIKNQKVTVTIEKDKNGVEVTVVKLDKEEFTKQLEENKEAKALVVSANSNSGKAKAVLQVNDMEDAAANNQDNVFIVQANGAEYTLPSDLVNSSAVSQGLGISEQDAGNAELNVSIEEKPDTTVKKGKSQLASKVVDFTISVTSGDNTVELNNFGNTYVNRAFDLTQNVSSTKAVGVVVNTDGTLSPVPTEFVEIDGKKVAVLKRNSNSTYAVVENEVALNDIAGHWGQADIQLLADKLIVTGFEDGSFRPNEQVTRAEFVALLVRALGLDATHAVDGLYTDVADDDWYAGALTAANQAGLVKGYADGSFRGNQTITRQDASVLLGNAIVFLQLRGNVTEEATRQALDTYKDADGVSGYAREAVGLASSLDILHGGGDGKFRPQSNATRAETVVMIENLMELAGFITY